MNNAPGINSDRTALVDLSRSTKADDGHTYRHAAQGTMPVVSNALFEKSLGRAPTGAYGRVEAGGRAF
jgi:hypothetical protein